MPDREFDIYLSLLSRLLRLKPGQRDAIADELRDHLEERLGELTAAGVSRDDAVRRALDEFGDAASLASRFTHLSLRKTRRLIMRWTFGTTLFAGLLALLATAFWPQEPGAPAPPVANAQVGGGFGPKTKPARPAVRGRTANSAQTAEFEKKLSTKLDEIAWVKTPAEKLFQEIGKKIKADILLDKAFVEDEGFDPKTEVTLVLGQSKITARTAIELVLEQAGLTNAAITNRDGLVYLTNRENDRYIEVYNCRDLLSAAAALSRRVRKPRRRGAGGIGGGNDAAGLGDDASGAAGPGGGFPGGGIQGGNPGMSNKAPKASPVGDALTYVIQSTVRSTPWQDIDGTGASIAEFNGLLVITAGHEAHREIKQLLEKMRDANKQREPQPKK